ncbi:unnamed protein product [Urochloa decumbens]|uniref:MSP domain-containing protein n=1 Tax=Urochloa decumbens TaxID=240449 RepID=A0ABC9FPJ5_9POAL
MRELPNLPQKQNISLILRSSISGDRYTYTFTDDSECEQFFQDAKETGNPVHELKVEAVFSLQGDTTSMIWSLYSPTSLYTLSGHSDKVNCLDFFTLDDQQYLISGSQDCSAKEKTCVHTIDAFMSPVVSVISLPDTPYITTGSNDGTIHLWSSYRTTSSEDGSIHMWSSDSFRVVVEQLGEISIMDIDTISEESSTASSTELIQVDPPELRLPVVQGVSSTLKITNITDHHHVAFSIWSFNDTADYNALPNKGVLSPKSTQQVVVTRVAHEWVPADLKLEEVVFVKATVVVKGLSSTDVTYDMFDDTKQCRYVQPVRLDVVFVPSEIISKVRLPWTLDVHPAEPWIMMTQGDNHIHIWDYETRAITSAKFIARKNCIMAGCSSGLIYVYGYNPVEKNPVKKIRVLQRHSKSVNSLAIHATESYVLSASQDGKILIWDYEKEWELLKTFHAKSCVQHVAFNPKDTNMFAIAQDKIVKMWNLHSDDCKLELSGHSDLVLCLDYISLGDKLYLITGSQDKTAKIWDCETGSCVQTLERHMDVVKIACRHQDVRRLITGSRDGLVHLWKWDSTTICTFR